nr:Chloride channel and Cystathionine beta-synthase domain containing protein [Haemonchus contortus]
MSKMRRESGRDEPNVSLEFVIRLQGSGIPEMKTVLRGVILKEYLTIRTLISKIIGLTLSLGTGLPIGKEGPLVHIASVVANQLNRFLPTPDGVFKNESRANEFLAAGCAVGVACTFSAPVGGVLFSIEVTSAYFAVRNYWRGFFAATCSATLFSVLRGLLRGTGNNRSAWSDLLDLSMEAHYQTTFTITDTYTSSELLAFAAMGLLCGILGALFILLHRTVVLFLRRNSFVKIVLQKYWLVYPAFVSFFMSAITYPLGFGKYLAGEEVFSHTVHDFFIACSWIHDTPYSCPRAVNESWIGPHGDISIFHSLVAFQITFFILSIIASTLPVPAGIFMPVFVLGGAFGRYTGEVLRVWYPHVIAGDNSRVIHPGAYAVVGAAAFCGAVTHTVSVAVIVFELTGQLVLLIPVMIAVLIANAVCSYLQPSIYDSIIKIKRLPYLPDISHSSSMYHSLPAEQFMTTPVAYVGKDSTYGEVQDVILKMAHVRAFPLVENKNSMVLLGSVTRPHLFKLIQSKLGVRARQAEATQRIRGVLNDMSRRYHVAGSGNLLTSKVSDITSPMGTKRFTIEAADTSNDGTIPQQSVKTGNLCSAVSSSSGGVPIPDYQKQRILAMGTKRLATVGVQSQADPYHTIGEVFRSITRKGRSKKDQDTEFDLHGEDREKWEKYVLEQTIDLTGVQIDPSPFQLIENTSLFKVHSLFSLLGLKRAYVTKAGRLVGVISLCDLRSAIEDLQSGVTPTPGETLSTDHKFETSSENDIDYLHPHLEVLTPESTMEDLKEMNEAQTPTAKVEANRRTSVSSQKPAHGLSFSKSDSCLRNQAVARSSFTEKKSCPAACQNAESLSQNGSNIAESGENSFRHRPRHVRIVITDDDTNNFDL